MTEVAKLSRVPLREVWEHEAKDFTTWLSDNLDVLDDVLPFSLSFLKRERAVGSLNVDLVAEDEQTGSAVVIENQLKKSDHSHLGKLITYLANLDAKGAVWIVEEPRAEHVDAIAWLNQSAPADFYLVKLEAVRIDESPPAPLMTRITGPSEDDQELADLRGDLSERHHLRKKFWTELLEKESERNGPFSHISPGAFSRVGGTANRSGIRYNYVIREHSAGLELEIETGDEDENERRFEALAGRRSEIEEAVGDLNWNSEEGVRRRTITKAFDVGGWRDKEKWPEIQQTLLDGMTRFKKALDPHIRSL